MHCHCIFIFDCVLWIKWGLFGSFFIKQKAYITALICGSALFESLKNVKTNPSPLSLYGLQSKCWGFQSLRPPISWAECGILLGYDSVIIQTESRFNWKEHFIYFLAFMLLLMNSESMKGKRKEIFKKEAEIQTFL